jgi:hypothetical protein
MRVLPTISYTYYAVTSGVPTAMAAGVGGKVRVVAIGHNALPGIQKWQAECKRRFDDDWYMVQSYNALAMLSEGMARAGSSDPVKVAAAMSGLRFRRRGRNAPQRPSTAAAALHHRVGACDRPLPLQRGKHGVQLPAGARDSGLHGEHAHVVPDEAPLSLPT